LKVQPLKHLQTIPSQIFHYKEEGEMKRAFTVILAVFALVLSGFGQSVAGLGAISGIVRDSAGGLIPNAKVLVTNTTRGMTRTLSTNESGVFWAPSLLPSGGYEVVIGAPGFSNFEAKEITLEVGKVLFLDAVLQVAGSTVQVDLQAPGPMIEQGKTDVSQVIATNQIMDLPINGRRVDSFVLLAPGVVPDGTFGLLSFRGIPGGNTFLTDGNDTTEQFYNENAGRTRISTQISQDAVQEFQVLADAYSAEFGRAIGGVVNTLTRSGSNLFHGSVYWFFRNRTFNARDPFATSNPPETRHQAGASAGGKLIANKLFYFLNGETTRRNFPLSASLTSPPFFDANGNFVAVQPGGAPTCGAPATAAQCTVAVSFLNRQFRTLDRTANSQLGFGKLDWQPTERDSVSVSFNYLRWLSPNGIQTAAATTNGSGIGNNATSSVRARYGRLSWTSLATTTAVNEFRFGWFKDKQFDHIGDQLALPEIGFLGITVQGQANLGTAVDYPRLNPSENRLQFADGLTWTRGRHAMKFGADIMSTEDYNDLLLNRAGTYSFPTFTAFAQDLTGNSTGAKHWQNYSQRFGNPIVDITMRDYAFYAQDQWRVIPNLALNFGVRYDYAALPQPISQSVNRVNPQYPQTGRIPNSDKNIAPRLGISYSFNRTKTVVRAGYGIFYARYQGGLIDTFFLQNGMSQQLVTLNGGVPQDLAAGPVFPNKLIPAGRGAPTGTTDLTFAAPNFRNAYTQQGNVAIDHEIRPNLALTVSYLWSRGLHLAAVEDLNIGPQGPPVTYRINDAGGLQLGTYTTPGYLRANRVDPNWNRINQVDSASNSYYNGLAVQLIKRFSHGIEAELAYTWSHAIDNNQGFGSQNVFFSSGPTTLTNADYRAEKGTSSLDERHRLTVNTIWSPVLSRRAGAIGKYLLNNWRISQLSTFGSGFPAQAAVSVSGTPFAGAAFNTSLNGFGGSARVPFLPLNSLLTDPILRTDARLTKILEITERIKLHVIFEAFNLLNHTYSTSVITRAYNASGGVLTASPRLGEGSAAGGFPDGTNARRAQIGARVLW
jgi:Carboxypeptidase regulatory-like domain/TonB dependent receptor